MARFIPVTLALALVLLGAEAHAAGGASKPAPAASAHAPKKKAFPKPLPVSGVVNLNTATEAELRLLPGVGPSKARAILEQRAKARFATTDQLMKVKGIGKKTYRKLKPHLAVSGPTTLRKLARPTAKKATREEELPELVPDPVETSAWMGIPWRGPNS